MEITQIRPFYPPNGNLQVGWFDSKHSRRYRHVIGGVCWPDRGIPGFVVLTGIGWEEGRPVYGITEQYLRDLPDAVSKLAELSAIADFFFTLESAPYTDFLTQLYRKDRAAMAWAEKLRHDLPHISQDGDPTELFRRCDIEATTRFIASPKRISLEECPQTMAGLQNGPRGWVRAEEVLESREMTAFFYILASLLEA